MPASTPHPLILAILLAPLAAAAQTQIWSAPAPAAAPQTTPPAATAPARAVAVGAAVLAQASGGWHRATVLETGPQGYKLRYDGWGAGWDEWLPPARLRLADGTPVAPPAGTPPAVTAPPPPPPPPSAVSPPMPPAPPAPNAPTAPTAPPPSADTAAAAYREGEQVWVSWTGSSHRARILQARGGQYLIRYDGYDSKWDEWVGAGRITGRIAGAATASGRPDADADDRTPPPAVAGARSPVGRWECATWDAGQINRIGGFTLAADGSYQDQNSRQSGRYSYQPASGRIAFLSGPQKIDAPISYQAQARNGAGMIRFDYGGGARLDCYRAATR